MGAQRLSKLLYGICSALLITGGLAVQLQPLDLLENDPHNVVARANDYSRLDLLSAETFLWGGLSGKGRYALGNFTAYMPGDHESLIAMEKFYPLLQSTECTQDSLTMNFKDEAAYKYGAEKWKWVNEAKNRTFLLVAGHGHCHWNEDRLPFIVDNVEFDDATNTIKTLGRVSDWVNATHSYDLFVGGRPISNKRDFDEPYTFDVSADLPLSHVKIGEGDVKITYDCSGCGTKGEFEFDFHIKTWLDIPTDVELIISPHGVEAIYEPRLGIQANLGGSWSPTLPLGTIPIDGISIAGGILDLGPEIKFDVKGTLGPLKGSAGVTGGGTLGLQDSASLTIDLLNPDISASGWTPTFSEKPFTVDAALQGSIQLQLDAGIDLALEALDHGFIIGVTLSPFYGATLSYSTSSGDACPNDPGKHAALKYVPSAGVNLIGEAAVEDNTESPIVSATLLSWVHTFESFCTGLDGGLTIPTGSFSSQSYSIPSTSSPTPHSLTSAPASSFPAPLTSIPQPSSWLTPRPSSGSSPLPSSPSSVPGSPQPSSPSSVPVPVPPSSASSIPVPPSSASSIPVPVPPSSGSSIPVPVPPSSVPPPPPGTSGSATVPPPVSSITPPPGGNPPPPPPPRPTTSSTSSVVPVVRRRIIGRK